MKRINIALAIALSLTPVASHATKYHALTYLESHKSELLAESALHSKSAQTTIKKFNPAKLHEGIQNAIVLVHSKVMEKVKILVSDKDAVQKIELQAFLLVADSILATKMGAPYAPEYVNQLAADSIAISTLKTELNASETELSKVEEKLLIEPEEMLEELEAQKLVLIQTVKAFQNKIKELEQYKILKPDTIVDWLKKPFLIMKKNPKATGSAITVATIVIIAAGVTAWLTKDTIKEMVWVKNKKINKQDGFIVVDYNKVPKTNQNKEKTQPIFLDMKYWNVEQDGDSVYLKNKDKQDSENESIKANLCGGYGVLSNGVLYSHDLNGKPNTKVNATLFRKSFTTE